MAFELNRVYKRDSIQDAEMYFMFGVCNETILCGMSLIGERSSGGCTRFDVSDDASVGWIEVSWGEYSSQFNYKDENLQDRKRQIYIEAGPLILNGEDEKSISIKTWLEENTWVQPDGDLDYSRPRLRPIPFD